MKGTGKWQKGQKTHMSVILDKMGHFKTSLPRTATRSKAAAFGDPRKMFGQSVMGCTIHGFGNIAFLLRDYIGTGGPSITIECLVRALLMYPPPLPDVLYLQLDNCSGDNKNAWVLAFAHWLVEAGVFQKVKLSFLVVGHTHEDIDGCFGVLSRQIAGKKIVTLSEMRREINRVFPRVEVVTAKSDYKRWIGGMDGQGRYVKKKHFHPDVLKYTSRPHVFRFKSGADGKVQMHYKKYMSSTKWFPSKIEPSPAPVAKKTRLADPKSSSLMAADILGINPARIAPIKKLRDVTEGSLVGMVRDGNTYTVGVVLDAHWTGDLDEDQDPYKVLPALDQSKRVKCSGYEFGTAHWVLSEVTRKCRFDTRWFASGRRTLVSLPSINLSKTSFLKGVTVGLPDDDETEDHDSNAMDDGSTSEDCEGSCNDNSDGEVYDDDDIAEWDWSATPKLTKDAVVDWSKAMLQSEIKDLTHECAMCPRLPNQRCTHRLPPHRAPRCKRCCERDDCLLPGHGADKKKFVSELPSHHTTPSSNRSAHKKEKSEGVHEIGKGLTVLRSIPLEKPLVHPWVEWEECPDVKDNVLNGCLVNKEIDANRKQREEWAKEFAWYEEHRTDMEHGKGSLKPANVLALLDRSRTKWQPGESFGDSSESDDESMEFSHDEVVGGGVKESFIKEVLQRRLAEQRAEIYVEVKKDDFVGVYMEPDRVNCPEHMMPVRVAQVLEVGEGAVADRQLRVMYLLPMEQRYDGKYGNWFPDIPGKKRVKYTAWVEQESLCCTFGAEDTAWKTGKKKYPRKLSLESIRVLASLNNLSNYFGHCDENSRVTKKVSIGRTRTTKGASMKRSIVRDRNNTKKKKVKERTETEKADNKQPTKMKKNTQRRRRGSRGTGAPRSTECGDAKRPTKRRRRDSGHDDGRTKDSAKSSHSGKDDEIPIGSEASAFSCSSEGDDEPLARKGDRTGFAFSSICAFVVHRPLPLSWHLIIESCHRVCHNHHCQSLHPFLSHSFCFHIFFSV